MARTPKPLPSLDWLKPRLRASRVVSVVAFLALAGLILAWNLFFANLHGARTWVVVTIQLVPLLLVAPGILTGSPRGHAWACFIVNLYFIQGVLAATDPSRSTYGWLLATVSVILFVGALLYTRWASQYARKAAGES